MIIYIFISFFLIELLLSHFWSRIYFRYGILVYKKSFKSNIRNLVLPDAEKLNNSYSSNWKKSIVFTNLGKNELAIREKLFEIKLAGYSPFIRGHIEHNRINNELTLRCYLNYTVSLLLLLLFISVFNDFDINLFNSSTLIINLLIIGVFVIFASIICGGITAYQIQQYKIITKEILSNALDNTKTHQLLI